MTGLCIILAAFMGIFAAVALGNAGHPLAATATLFAALTVFVFGVGTTLLEVR